MAHVRVQQFHHNIPVLGGEAIAHLTATGEPSGQTDDLLPNITVDPETYEVRVDGEILTCEPAATLPLAQRYFLF